MQPSNSVHSQWPGHKPVATMPGSLPMGGTVPMTPIHAFNHPEASLRLSHQPLLQPVRQDIDLGGLLAFTIKGVMTSSEAAAMVQASERFGYRSEAPGISTPPGMRMNKSVHWVADDELTLPLFKRIAHLLPPRIGTAGLHTGFSQRINMYRYDANDVFNRHTDGDWPGYSLSRDRREMLQWSANLRSALTMLLYLNGPDDGVLGGNTRLYTPQGAWVDVVPSAGSALFFRHGFGADSVVHEGCRVHSSVPKYVARINVMYAAASQAT